MPTSWLTPALAVQRSTLALSSTVSLIDGVSAPLDTLPSGAQSTPLLLWRFDCVVIACVAQSVGELFAGSANSSRRVGEYGPPPAPMKIVWLVFWFAFHARSIVYGVLAVSVHTVCTNAAF